MNAHPSHTGFATVAIPWEDVEKRTKLDDREYRSLFLFRTSIRRFLQWSQGQTDEVGLTPTQHLVLLAVRVHDHHRGPTIGEVASALTLRHHSAVELVDRTESAGFVRRVVDDDDQRVVRLRLTAKGSRAVERISASNLRELRRLRPELRQLDDLLDELDEPEHG